MQCRACRSDLVKTVNKLQHEMSEIRKNLVESIKLADVSPNLSSLSHFRPLTRPLNQLDQSLDVTSFIPRQVFFPSSGVARQPVNPLPASSVTKGEVCTMVAGAVQDLNRRKKNVIITGLMEKPGQSDLRVVTDIFSKCLPLTNPPTIFTVYRLGCST